MSFRGSNNNNNSGGNSDRSHQRRQRAQDFRKSAGATEMRAFDAHRNNTLFEGFGSLNTYLQQIPLHVLPSAVELPISTRGVGLLVDRLWNRLALQYGRQMETYNVHSLYRVTMAQVTLKLCMAHRGRREMMYVPQQTTTVVVDYDTEQVVISNPSNFSLLSGVINMIGNFVHQGVHYYPGLVANEILSMAYGNLNNAIALSSNPATDAATRERYRLQMYIAGAEWRQHMLPPPRVGGRVEARAAAIQDGMLLTNPQVLVTGNLDQLRADFTSVNALMTVLARKAPQYCGRVTFNDQGSCGQLISSDYRNADEQWSSHALGGVDAAMGVIGMLGEVPYADDFSIHEVYHARSRKSCAMMANMNWATVVDALLS